MEQLFSHNDRTTFRQPFSLTHQSRSHSKSSSIISYQPISLSKSPTTESKENGITITGNTNFSPLELQTFKFNYEDIVLGKIPPYLLDLKNIENQLNEEDTLEYLGLPISQMKILSSVDIYLRKKRAFLLPQQILAHIVTKKE